jgi:putative cell wall-binding protein
MHHSMTGMRRLAGPAVIAALLVVAGAARVAHAADAMTITRLAGADRYATAAAVSAASFAPGVDAVYIAAGTDFPDALSGAAAAGSRRDPLLLVPPSSIPAVVATEISRLKPGRIFVLGSTGVISSGVETALHAFTAGGVMRLAGRDRYATSAAISAATFQAGVPLVYVATGADFPDALAGAAAAGHAGVPVLLVAPTSIPAPIAKELGRLAPARIAVLGGTGAVSASVMTALGGYTKGAVVRIAGADRYATAVAISAATYPKSQTAYLATGANFPDALAGASLDGPLLLVDPGTSPRAVHDEIVRLGASRVVVLGGTAPVPTTLAAAAAGIGVTAPTGHWTGNLYRAAGVRWQQPDTYACAATSAMMMLNFVALGSTPPGDGFAWTPSVSLDLQTQILAYERANMTMVLDGTNGTDPHGWRNALNFYGWGSLTADIYRDQAFATADAGLKAAVVAAAEFGKSTGMLMLNGKHAEVINGWDVEGADPSTGSTDFTINGVWLTDPWQPSGRQDAYVQLPWLQSAASGFLRFGPYLETDSPGTDPIDGKVGKDEWYGKYVIVAAVR